MKVSGQFQITAAFLKDRKSFLPQHILDRITGVLHTRSELSGEETNSLVHVGNETSTRKWSCHNSTVDISTP
jgi:hypothetical protein